MTLMHRSRHGFGDTGPPCSLMFQGPYDVRPDRCNPSHGDLESQPDDLEASTNGAYIPAFDASRPDDLGSVSLVVPCVPSAAIAMMDLCL